MIILSAEYRNFRNIKSLVLEPCAGVNVIYGENAQGKTNILEGLWSLSGFKSFRASRDAELVKFGCDFASVRTLYDDGKRENEAEVIITGRRKISLNGIGMKSSSAMIGRFNTVIFSPEFLNIVKNSPEERRNFIDTAICRLSPASGAVMSEYNRILKQRNALIKNGKEKEPDPALLDITDEALGMYGEKLIKLRRRYIDIIAPRVNEIYSGISGGREEISIRYVQKHGEEGSIVEVLKKYRERDIITGITIAGPHRDDLDIRINGIPARMYGSQGQQRSCAIALKLGESDIITEKTGVKPVVLLDDVMSELDVGRQNYILNNIGDRQVFITCCEPETVKRLGEGKKFEIRGGETVSVSKL